MDCKNRVANVLLVEDDMLDAELVKKEFSKNRLITNLDIVTSGEDALAYLFKPSIHQGNAADLVLLDIKLPGMNGLDTLKEIRKNNATTLLPVAVLTSSKRDEDLLEAYTNLADVFISKPLRFSSVMKILSFNKSLSLSLTVNENFGDVNHPPSRGHEDAVR